MKHVIVPFLLATIAHAENPAGIPADYRLLYAQDFAKPEAANDFLMTDSTAWTTSIAEGKAAFELTKQSKYEPPFRSPFNIALLNGKSFGDVVFEADCQQTGKEYGHRDMIFVYGYQDPAHFYYTHIATAGGDRAHNCFIVNGAPRLKFASEVTKGVNWGLGVWHHVRIERKVSTGTVRVFFDDMEKPIMSAEEETFGPGAIGFGSFDDTGKIASVKVWGTAVESTPTKPFPTKP